MAPFWALFVKFGLLFIPTSGHTEWHDVAGAFEDIFYFSIVHVSGASSSSSCWKSRFSRRRRRCCLTSRVTVEYLLFLVVDHHLVVVVNVLHSMEMRMVLIHAKTDWSFGTSKEGILADHSNRRVSLLPLTEFVEKSNWWSNSFSLSIRWIPNAAIPKAVKTLKVSSS